MSGKYFLTTPLYYVNSKPHIGHSYTEIAADALSRFMRLTGKEVLFLTGTDEHGQKIARAAAAAGMEPQPFTDKMSDTFRTLWKTLNISYDDFIRTTEARHREAVRRVWTELEKKGEIYAAAYSGYYCTPCETFLTDEAVREQEARGEAVVCPDCKRPVEKLEETNYFFKISTYQDWLIGLIEGKDPKDKMVVLPETRRNEVLGFLRNHKLADLCISRPKNRLAWGIESPLSKEHVTYVWFDALINYITAPGYGDEKKKVSFKKWWPADVHIIGKDILRHHAIYWPILLHALGLELPRMIFAHGWWVQGGEKMSKSKGNVVDPVEIVKTYGVDAYRYFLLSEAPFGQDGTFSEEALIERYNMALANDLGNLLHRSLTMCEKYFDGNIPQDIASKCAGELRQRLNDMAPALSSKLEKLAFSEALAEIWALVNAANKFIEEKAPWKLSKEQKTEELKAVIVELMEVLKAVAQAVWPFMPQTADGIWRQLGIDEPIEKVPFKENMWGYFQKGGKIAKGAPLFPRIEVAKPGQ
ncbi:MAG: methionine--tRNA ligase [Candidatus Omnitrophota bacterium]